MRNACTGCLQSCSATRPPVYNTPVYKMSLKPQADHTMCLRLISDDMRGTESLMVIKKSSENCISILNLGLNISLKLNEMLIDAFVVFFNFKGHLEPLFTKFPLAGDC